MGLDLAFLAIDRAPYTGHLHACLLVIALDADARDVVKMTHGGLAWQARISRRKAQEAMKVFEDAGLLTRLRLTDPRNPHAHRFQFHRDVLFAYPKRGLSGLAMKVPPRRVCGLHRANQEKRVRATIDAAARDAAARVKLYTSLSEPQRLAFLRALRP